MADKEPNMIADLVALQKALPVMPKDTSNPFFKSKYTSLDTITEIAFPIMTKHNFAWTTQPSFTEDGAPTLKYALLHTTGEKIEGEMKLLLKSQDPQGQGSAITYARRYALTSVLGIVSDEDDDGNSARKAAEQARTYNRDDFQPEPARDINEDIDSYGITTEYITKLAGQLKLKGITERSKIMGVLNNLAKTKGGETIKDISLHQANELFELIKTTDKGALEMLTGE
jgi:hypothetical protein